VVDRRGAARCGAATPGSTAPTSSRPPAAPGFARVQDERGRRSAGQPSTLAARSPSVASTPTTRRSTPRRSPAPRRGARPPRRSSRRSPGGPQGARRDAARARRRRRLPGLVVDRYADVVVLQSGSAALRAAPRGARERLRERTRRARRPRATRRAVARARGLAARGARLAGLGAGDGRVPLGRRPRAPSTPWRGQKTGGFLDQRVNWRRLAAHAGAAASTRSAYGGGFGLHLALGAGGAPGVAELELIDASAARSRRPRPRFVATICPPRTASPTPSPDLRELDGAARSGPGSRYDVVSLDPPALAKRRGTWIAPTPATRSSTCGRCACSRPAACSGTSSCSFHVSDDGLPDDAGRRRRRRRPQLPRAGPHGAAPDHPERLGFPESRYLAFVMLQALD
jgi:23S rRNA (cytosine1962-C5)-methyltransferase